MRGIFYTYPSELSSKRLKNVELVRASFVHGQFGIDVLTDDQHSRGEGERKRENNEAALKTNALGEKSVYIFFFHLTIKIA